MDDWILDEEVELDDLDAVFSQIFNALSVANTLYEYSHRDLHCQNILVRNFLGETRNYFALPVYDNKIQIKGHILTKQIPYIIDYGESSASIGEKFFGMGENLAIQDVYRILTETIRIISTVIEQNQENSNYIRKFFFLTQIALFFGKMSYFSLPKEIRSKTLQDFLDFYWILLKESIL